MFSVDDLPVKWNKSMDFKVLALFIDIVLEKNLKWANYLDMILCYLHISYIYILTNMSGNIICGQAETFMRNSVDSNFENSFDLHSNKGVSIN